ncbi:MAG TPA: serine hydrolase domain-containing protein [Candidatus Aminicenantes bacterium]|nr:serine hydrolase domain-containing protein [Candidatus Aminicenantes bacterium]
MRTRVNRRPLIRISAVAVVAVVAASLSAGPAQAPAPGAKPGELTAEAKVDRVFERFNRSDTPGCVVGVAAGGKPVLVKAYGMADLERGVRLRPDSVFESGSVAKQFTAAAVALLCRDGKLSLDDPVRKYVPEVPDFGPPVLIRHLLNHTSGLRSQWSLLGLAGRPTGWAVHTVEEILELVGRMRELNFKPGDEYLYCNTGYTLLGVVVARVSGKTLDAFCQERLFKPLGMTRTRWREDFRTIVPDRATAYGRLPDGRFFTNMPFTSVIGNGGLLTTAGDLLLWNGNLDEPRVGGPALVEQLETRGRLNDGFELEYAQGLVVTAYKGLREVGHGGSTAGYQAFLARYPSERLSIAVLSNLSGSGPAGLARQVADIYLAGKIEEPAKPVAAAVPASTLKKYLGVYRERLTDAAMRVELDKNGKTLRFSGLPALPLSATTFMTPDGSRRFVFEPGTAGSSFKITDTTPGARPRLWEAAPPFAPRPADLDAFAGAYYSYEIDTTYTLFVKDGRLLAHFRPAQLIVLRPIYDDAFESDEDVFRFSRDASGRVDSFRVYAGRAWRVLFGRIS